MSEGRTRSVWTGNRTRKQGRYPGFRWSKWSSVLRGGGEGPPLGRSPESDPLVVRVFVGLEASVVDDYLMVVPADEDHVFLVGRSAFSPRGEMVRFQPLSAVTSVHGAAVPVLAEQRPFLRRRDRALFSTVVEVPTVSGPGDDFGGGVAENCLERLTASVEARLEHHTRFGVCLRCVFGVNEDRDLRRWGIIRNAELSESNSLSLAQVTLVFIRKCIRRFGQHFVDQSAGRSIQTSP